MIRAEKGIYSKDKNRTYYFISKTKIELDSVKHKSKQKKIRAYQMCSTMNNQYKGSKNPVNIKGI